MMEATQDRNLAQLIDDHFIKDPDVHEVVMYALSCLAINDAITAAQMSDAKEVRGISPQSYHLMKMYDHGLTTNKFWIENYAPIKLALSLSDIKNQSNNKYISLSQSQGVKDEDIKRMLKASRSILMTRLDVLTIIAFLWKGPAYAQDFDVKFRMVFQLTPEHEKYYHDGGI